MSALARSEPCPLAPVAEDTLPPSRAAHRLAWWLSPTWWWMPERARVLRLRVGAGVSADDVERMMTGELVPADDVAIAIARVTAGAVLPEDWIELTTRCWIDRPTPRAD